MARRSEGHTGKSGDDVGQVEATIEAAFELREISLGAFGANRMAGAAQRTLDIAENGVPPTKLRALDAGFPASRHNPVMSATRRGDAMEAGQTIGHHRSAGAQVPVCPGGDFAGAEPFDDRELQAQRVSVLVGLDGGHERGLGRRPSPALAAASLAAETGIVELDPGR